MTVSKLCHEKPFPMNRVEQGKKKRKEKIGEKVKAKGEKVTTLRV